MGNMHLVTGYAGQEHITAEDQAAFNAALIGKDQFVLDKGNALEAQVVSNNNIRILDGELMMQGRFVRLDPGAYVDLTIENGTQGMLRNDLIVARYTKDTTTGIEGVNLVVIKGTPVASNPVDPEYTENDITDGSATLHDFPLWRIPITGLNVGTPVALFGEPFIDSMRTLPEIRNAVNTIHGKVDKQLAEQDAEIDKKIAELDEYTKNEVLTSETKALFGLDASAVPDEVFSLLLSAVNRKLEVETGSYIGTGTAGMSNPNRLTFDFEPQIVLIARDDYNGFGIWFKGSSDMRYFGSYSYYGGKVTVTDNAVEWWYGGGINEANCERQLNLEGITYNYLAIGI